MSTRINKIRTAVSYKTEPKESNKTIINSNTYKKSTTKEVETNKLINNSKKTKKRYKPKNFKKRMKENQMLLDGIESSGNQRILENVELSEKKKEKMEDISRKNALKYLKEDRREESKEWEEILNKLDSYDKEKRRKILEKGAGIIGIDNEKELNEYCHNKENNRAIALEAQNRSTEEETQDIFCSSIEE